MVTCFLGPLLDYAARWRPSSLRQEVWPRKWPLPAPQLQLGRLHADLAVRLPGTALELTPGELRRVSKPFLAYRSL